MLNLVVVAFDYLSSYCHFLNDDGDDEDGATFNREEKDKGRTDQEFSSGYSEFEIRLSHGVLKRQPDRKLWRL